MSQTQDLFPRSCPVFRSWISSKTRSQTVDSQACLTCQEDTYSETMSSNCTVCPVGLWSPGPSSWCTQCVCLWTLLLSDVCRIQWRISGVSKDYLWFRSQLHGHQRESTEYVAFQIHTIVVQVIFRLCVSSFNSAVNYPNFSGNQGCKVRTKDHYLQMFSRTCMWKIRSCDVWDSVEPWSTSLK